MKKYRHNTCIPSQPNNKRTKNVSKKKKHRKEMDYEKLIQTFLIEKYLAMGTMNYIDQESEKNLEEINQKQRKNPVPIKKMFNQS